MINNKEQSSNKITVCNGVKDTSCSLGMCAEKN